MQFVLPPALTAEKTGITDPIHYYRRPGVGWLFRQRIAMGLDMIPPLPSDARALEVGYASGLVLFNLAAQVSELHGIDIDADPVGVSSRLAPLGVRPKLVRGSVLDMTTIYESGYFDLVVCFSVMEHIRDTQQALSEMTRVLKPGGSLLIGMPAVNRMMEIGFEAIGFRGIEDHHITTPSSVWRLVSGHPDCAGAERRSLPRYVPFGVALYHTFLVRKLQTRSS